MNTLRCTKPPPCRNHDTQREEGMERTPIDTATERRDARQHAEQAR
jgi:hypothetical protein